MATVKQNILRVLQVIDPRMKDQTEITSSNFSTWVSDGGDKFAAQRVLDIYNEARVVLLQTLIAKFPTEDFSLELGTQVASYDAFTFTNSGGIAFGNKPGDYIKFLSLTFSTGRPIILLSADKLPIVKEGVNPYYKETEINVFVFELGDSFFHYGGFIPDGNDYILTYIGITDYVMSGVTNNATESINNKYVPVLIELCQAIATEQGTAKVNALAQKLIGE